MWLMTTQGFYSAVEHREDPALILVRSRAKRDLEELDRQLPGAAQRIRHTLDADYAWRLICSREEWTLAVARLCTDVSYDNFKSAVAKGPGGWERERVYHRVWSALLSIQATRPWSRFSSAADTFPFEERDDAFDRDLFDDAQEQSRSVSRSKRRRQQRQRAKKNGAKS